MNCEGCQQRFTLLKRRHHCRRCGRIFCDDCSGNSQSLPQYDQPVRVCDDCYHTENYLRLNRFLKLSSKEAGRGLMAEAEAPAT